MSYTKEGLKKKLLDMYPEITTYDLSVEIDFDKGRNAWVVTFMKGNKSRHAFLNKGDANACVDGNECIYLGILIAQYIKDLEAEISGK